MKLQELRATCKQWATKLGLAHWKISIRWMNEEESEEHPGINGFCYWSADHTHGWIRISKDSEDILHTTIHEILHLRLDGHLPMTYKKSVPLEVTINALTAALLESVDRGTIEAEEAAKDEAY